MKTSIFDIEIENWLGDIYEMQGHMFAVLEKIPAHELLLIFRSYMELLVSLNNLNFSRYVYNEKLCNDSMEFYNLRSAIIVGGRDVCNRILLGQYELAVKFLDFKRPIIRFGDAMRSSMLYSYVAKTGRDLIADYDFYSDDLFVKSIMNPVLGFKKYDDDGFQYSVALGGEVLQEACIDGLGIICRGDFIRHEKFGIGWLYVIAKNSFGRVKALVLFKDLMRNVLISDVASWSRYEFNKNKNVY